MSLVFVESLPAAPTLNVLLYGPEGSGKTYASLSAPGPLLVLNAEGPGGIVDARAHFGEKVVREVAVAGPSVFDEVELYLKAGGDGERTVVLDSVGAAYVALVDHFSSGGKPTLPNYGDASLRLERFCRFLRDVPFNAVVVAHEIGVKDEHTGLVERLPYTGSSNPALGVKLMAMFDVVGFTGRGEPIEPDGGPRWMSQVVAGHGRRAKNRGDFLPEFVESDLTAWLDMKHAKQAATLAGASTGGAA